MSWMTASGTLSTTLAHPPPLPLVQRGDYCHPWMTTEGTYPFHPPTPPSSSVEFLNYLGSIESRVLNQLFRAPQTSTLYRRNALAHVLTKTIGLEWFKRVHIAC